MTNPYKKRAKAGWNSDKKESNRAERNYEETDIDDQLAETTKVGAKTKKAKSSKEDKKLLSIVRDLRFCVKLSGGDVESLSKASKNRDWFDSIRQSYYQKCRKGIPELKKALENKDLDKKVRKQIEEVLDKVGDIK